MLQRREADPSSGDGCDSLGILLRFFDGSDAIEMSWISFFPLLLSSYSSLFKVRLGYLQERLSEIVTRLNENSDGNLFIVVVDIVIKLNKNRLCCQLCWGITQLPGTHMSAPNETFSNNALVASFHVSAGWQDIVASSHLQSNSTWILAEFSQISSKSYSIIFFIQKQMRRQHQTRQHGTVLVSSTHFNYFN